MKKGPNLKLKVFFWIILGTLTTFFAEVFAGSQLFPFYTFWGLVVVYPLYAVHLIVLGSFVFLKGRPRLYALFPAGAVFGLYEAYITKVVWNPYWGLPVFSVGGIAVVETMVLVLFWHAFMAFIVPLLVAETLLTNSREIREGIPGWIKGVFGGKKRAFGLLVFIFIMFGSFQSINTHSPAESFLSGLSSGLVPAILMYLWGRTSGPKYTMRELLPGKRALWVFFAMLMVIYLVLGVFLRPEVIPGPGPQAVVWVMYLFFFALLGLALRWSRKVKVPAVKGPPLKFSLRTFFLVCVVVFALSSFLTKLVFPPFALLSVLVLWFGGVVLGLVLVVLGLRNSLKGK